MADFSRSPGGVFSKNFRPGGGIYQKIPPPTPYSRCLPNIDLWLNLYSCFFISETICEDRHRDNRNLCTIVIHIVFNGDYLKNPQIETQKNFLKNPQIETPKKFLKKPPN